MDLSTVKAEIKAWEREFKAANGRHPTIQDIKTNPEIADKYRLYKRLSRKVESSTVSSNSNSEPPSTPKRSRSRGYNILPPNLLVEPRAIATTAPLSSFNPFSPQKNKDRRNIPITNSTNVFGSDIPPSSPFSTLKLPKASTSSVTPSHGLPVATSALSRARKRLRGEPVSPSPVKGKRRRTGSQTNIIFENLASDSLSEEEEGEGGAKALFVSDSPVKAPAGPKLFKVLFYETHNSSGTGPSVANDKAFLAQPKAAHGGTMASELDIDTDVNRQLDGVEPKPGTTKHKAGPFKTHVAIANRTTQTSKQEPPTGHETTTAKRPLSDTEVELPDELPHGSSFLLPPSPPPPDTSTHRSNHFSNAGGKGKMGLPRHKKARTGTGTPLTNMDDHSEDDSDSLEINVKIASRNWPWRHPTGLNNPAEGEHEFYSDTDPILVHSRPMPRGVGTSTIANLAGSIDINIPDKLRNVLALETTDSEMRHSLEEQLVRGLVLGRRAVHYDPVKGGEIWDVGEDDIGEGAGKKLEDEDEWEGEPVPWEIGEL